MKNIFLFLLLFTSASVQGQLEAKTKSLELWVLDIASQKRQTIELLNNNLALIKDSLTGEKIYSNGYQLDEFKNKETGAKDYSITASVYFDDSNGDKWQLFFRVVNYSITNSEEKYAKINVLLCHAFTKRFNEDFPEFEFNIKGRVEDIFNYKIELFNIKQMRIKNGKEFSLMVRVKQ